MKHPPVRSVRRFRAALAAAGGALVALLVTEIFTRLALTVADTLAGEGLAGLLTMVSAAACALVAARLTLCLTATTVAAALPPAGRGRERGGRVALALSPRAVRPVVALLLSAGLAAGSAISAAAASTPACSTSGTPAREPAWWAVAPSAPGPTAGVPAGSADFAGSTAAASASGPAGAPVVSGGRPPREGGLPDPLWPVLPEPGWTPPPPPPAPLLAPADAALMTSGAAGTDAAAARAALTADDQVVVRRGDSLWRIAERHLGADATDAEVAVEWPRWWHANRRVVGPDPDLLLPGTRLTPPDG
jgi:nucleoid-associated protein YgaU